MSDNQDQSRGGYDPTDPWAPPNRDGVELSKPTTPSPSPVHDQQTVTSVPLAQPGPTDLPPPPVAPGGPAAAPGAYGYPAADTSGGYGYPSAVTPPAAPASSGYGYPGYPSPGGYPGQTGWQQSPSNGMGTASMVLGIIAVAGFCLYGLGAILGILALIFGIIGIKKCGRGEATNRGMAIAGIVLGAIGTLVSAVFLGFVIWAVSQDSTSFEDSGYDEDPFASSLVVENGSR
ncbi:DUF4190 domain-containing protein [Streptomyces sp. NPDC006553]|uniref:DUF4190 domain-containing protein n=1 Tax=unclassified Streptomyces TaxID=2593676 RepID=UPI002252BD02|nr:DUF4190 domain-containing protein [Streptomyces sp. NBC_00233]MCX5229014.1 DUF4190 domain-containing protein [Streptomyces sp. NBC_00233]